MVLLLHVVHSLQGLLFIVSDWPTCCALHAVGTREFPRRNHGELSSGRHADVPEEKPWTRIYKIGLRVRGVNL